MNADFPAAHSMDTTWYAVDRAGHVGEFRSWEAGAVPQAADFQVDWHRAQPATPVAADLFGWRAPCEPQRAVFAEHRLLAHLGSNLAGVVFLGPDASLPTGPGIRELPACGGKAVTLELPIGLGWLRELHDREECLGCYPEATEPEPGLFVYEHHQLYENWVPGPYGRHWLPLQPLHVDQFPPVERAALLKLRFPTLSFAATPHLQPADHLGCLTYGDAAFVSGDGRFVRPLPGRSAGDFRKWIKYAQQYYAEQLRGLKIDWPGRERGAT